ncbi:MAG TPA: FecR domain-containing protein [Gemmatales bacterium]|nr:FecR domain-containing protein [Gemmatales bacterium]
MNCASIQILLSAWMDRELSSDQVLQVEHHLANCATCKSVLEEMQRLDQQLRAKLPPSPEEVQRLIDSTLFASRGDALPFRPRPWRTIAMTVASAAAGFLLAVVLLPEWFNKPIASKVAPSSTQAALDLPVQLALAIGVVEIEEQGTWKPLATGTKLQAGQRIRTPERSRCELRCADGSEIRLNSNSEIIIHSPRLFHLKQGQVWSTVAAATTPFRVKTDQTTVTALGTQFDLNYQVQRTTLSVLEGKTRFDLQGKVAEVKAGQQLLLDNGKGTFDIRDPNPDYALYQATNWVNEILVLKGRDNPELNRRINDVMASIGETKMAFLAEEEIRTLGDHCVVPLCRYLQSARSQEQEMRREMAARIIADLAQPRSIGDLIELLSDTNPQVRSSMAHGLARLTKQDMGLSPQLWQTADAQKRQLVQKKWKEWWKANQSKYPDTGSKA